ncbi:MAG: hypothetical protein V4676_00485, partial [Bacteroidota bacterium]
MSVSGNSVSAITTVAAPTVTDVKTIAAITNPVLRNLQITQCYAELSTAFAQRTGPFANWCSYATWASKQAGQTIRTEDLQRTLETLITKRGGFDDSLLLII